MDDDNSLNSKEWQLYLVLKELQSELDEKEKKEQLGEWLKRKVEELHARSGW
jgi:hypothetical protein